MFQFPRCPLMAHATSARPCVGRVAPFGDLRIAGCQRLPGAFRRVAASFLGRQRQGIHHALVFRNAPHPRSHAGPARATRTWQHAAIAAGGQGLLRPCSLHAVSSLSLSVLPRTTTETGNCVIHFLSVHAPARAPQGPPRPVTAARPYGSDVARCQGTSRTRGARQLGRDDTSGTPSRPGGAAGIRTPDLRRARAALSRLSYGPRISPASLTPPGWARLDSNQGPRPYQGRALTT